MLAASSRGKANARMGCRDRYHRRWTVPARHQRDPGTLVVLVALPCFTDALNPVLAAVSEDAHFQLLA
jgi:hypothetical protein